jgi:hypothetical protein
MWIGLDWMVFFLFSTVKQSTLCYSSLCFKCCALISLQISRHEHHSNCFEWAAVHIILIQQHHDDEKYNTTWEDSIKYKKKRQHIINWAQSEITYRNGIILIGLCLGSHLAQNDQQSVLMQQGRFNKLSAELALNLPICPSNECANGIIYAKTKYRKTRASNSMHLL